MNCNRKQEKNVHHFLFSECFFFARQHRLLIKNSNPFFLFLGRFGRVIIVAKDNNTNMLRTEVWKELRQLDELVQNMTVTLPNGETFTYKDECARWEGQCFVNDILNLDKIIGEVRFDHFQLLVFAIYRACQILGERFVRVRDIT